MKIVALGELLIDFTGRGLSDQGMALYERNPGGAPANMLAAAAKLGIDTAIIAKVGADMHGQYLKAVLEQYNIDTSALVLASDVFTTLAFVDVAEDGARTFSFARKPGADTCLNENEVPQALIDSCDIFHFGSLSLTDSPAREATFCALEYAKAAGKIISYDPNYRASLWSSAELAQQRIRQPLDFVDILKFSDEETELVAGVSDPAEASEIMHKYDIPVVVVTLGPKGALVRNKEGCAVVPGFSAKAVDTTGAGDAFMGAFLAGVLRNQQPVSDISLDSLKDVARYANAVASLSVRSRGGIFSMPCSAEVNQLMASL